MHRFPTSLDPKKVVIEAVETVKSTDKLVQACTNIKELGYKIALDDQPIQGIVEKLPTWQKYEGGPVWSRKPTKTIFSFNKRI